MLEVILMYTRTYCSDLRGQIVPLVPDYFPCPRHHNLNLQSGHAGVDQVTKLELGHFVSVWARVVVCNKG